MKESVAKNPLFFEISLLMLLLMVFTATPSNAWIPISASTRNYGNYKKLDQKAYYYDVVWYENTNGETASWINADGSSRFPLTIKELDRTLKTYTTKQQFIDDIVIPAINEFNNKIPGYGFFYRSTYGSSDSLWDSDDGTSVIQIYRQSSGDGGGNAAFYYDKIGYRMSIGDPDSPTTSNVSRKKWDIFAFRHELLHNLFFNHKDEGEVGGIGNPYLNYNRLNCNLTDGEDNNIFRELNEDTMAGIDEVYNTGNHNLTIQGYVSDNYSFGFAKAYLVNESTHKIIYQAPIDSTGFYRFRLIHGIFPENFRVLVVNEKANNSYYGDYVRYNNVAYKCILNHTNQKPPNATYWIVVNPIGGVRAVSNANNWNSTTAYKAAQTIFWNYSSSYTKPSFSSTFTVSTMSLDRSGDLCGTNSIEVVSRIQTLYSNSN